MMTFEEKTTNIDVELRDDRYYILFRGHIRYQTDDLDDAVSSLNLCVGAWLKANGFDVAEALPISFANMEESAKTDYFHRDAVVVMLHDPDLEEDPRLVAVGYGFDLEAWKARIPAYILEAGKSSPAEVMDEVKNRKVH